MMLRDLIHVVDGHVVVERVLKIGTITGFSLLVLMVRVLLLLGVSDSLQT